MGPLAPSSANELVGGPGLGWPPRQPVAPGDASFCLRLEGTQQTRAAKSGRTFYGRLLVTLPA